MVEKSDKIQKTLVRSPTTQLLQFFIGSIAPTIKGKTSDTTVLFYVSYRGSFRYPRGKIVLLIFFSEWHKILLGMGKLFLWFLIKLVN